MISRNGAREMMKFLKKRLGRLLVLAGLAALVALVYGASARADFFTQLATVDQTVAGGATAVTNVILINGSTSGGGSFGNRFSRANGMLADGPPAVGDEVHIVGADQILAYSRSDGSTPSAMFGSNKVVGVFALRAVIESISGGSIVAHLLEGGLRLYDSPDGSGSFNQRRPTSWGATDPLTAHLTLLPEISQYVLKPDEPVRQGNSEAQDPGPVFLDPNKVNRSAVNATLGAFTDGNALFREVSDPDDFINASTFDNPTNLPVLDEGLWVTVRDLNVGPGLIGSYTAPLLAPLDPLAVLERNAINTIYTGIVGSSVFANFFSGMADDYTPDGFVSNGDAALQTGATAEPGIQVIPEPASVVLFSIMTVGMGLYSGLRRRGQKAFVA